jgi:hypothetical protein
MIFVGDVGIGLHVIPKPIRHVTLSEAKGLEARFFAACAAQNDSFGRFRDRF